MTTQHTDSVEAVQKWLKEQGSGYCYVGDTEDLSSVCLDGWFDLEGLIATLQATNQQQVEEATRKVLCSRTGTHTCRMGAVHVTEGEKQRIVQALTPNHQG